MELLKLKTQQEIDKLLDFGDPHYTIMWVQGGCWLKTLSYQTYKFREFRTILLRNSFAPTIYIYGRYTKDNYWAAKSIETFTKDYLKTLHKNKDEVTVKICLS